MKSKTLLFCTAYFANQEQWDSRYKRWLDHHLAIAWQADAVAIIDDGSPWLPATPRLEVLDPASLGKRPLPPRALVHFPNNLGRQRALRYPGWWRSFHLALDLAEIYGFNKIVHVESDSYLLSTRMLDYIESIDSGWTSFWSAHFGWPETAIQVICQDAFSDFHKLREQAPHGVQDQAAEDVLPFTHVCKDFIGDRYSDFRMPIPKNADYAVQVLPGMPICVPSSLTRRLKHKTLAHSNGSMPARDETGTGKAAVTLGALDDAAQQRERGMSAYRRGDFAGAITELTASQAILPNDAEMLKFLAAAYMQTERTEEAIAIGEKAAALAPSDAGLANMLGAFYAAADNGRGALEQWSRALAIDPADLTVLSNIKATEVRLGLAQDVSQKQKSLMIERMVERLAGGDFSRAVLNSLLRIWDPNQESPTDVMRITRSAWDAISTFSEEEIRGLAVAAFVAGDWAGAMAFIELIVELPSAQPGDLRLFEELKTQLGRSQ